jgi:protein-disulfide isomerase
MPLALALTLVIAMPPCSIGAAEITPAERQEIERIIHDYLMENPDVLIEALRGAKDKLNRDANAKAKQVLGDHRRDIFDDPATPVGGNPLGDVAVVEFFDYRCPYCKQVEPSLQTLLNQDHQLRLFIRKCRCSGPSRSSRPARRWPRSVRASMRPSTRP